MRWSEKELSDLIDKYTDEIKEKFIKEVKEGFFKLAHIEYKNFVQLQDNDTLEEFFKASVFKKLLEEDINYVFEKSEEYWSNHIIKEINSIIDFDELSKMQ